VRSRRVGGSGWAGVHGSFIGVSKAKPAGKVKIRAPKPKTNKPEPLAGIDFAKLPDDPSIQLAAKRVQAVQADIASTRARLKALELQMATVSQALKTALDLAWPQKLKKRPSKSQTKIGTQAKEQKLAEKVARGNYRNATKEVEVEHRSNGVIVRRRIVTRS